MQCGAVDAPTSGRKILRPSAVFEEEVRRIARELFPQGKAFGPVIVDGRERDGVIDTGENIHIIEATCLPTKKKARDDLEKSIALKKDLSRIYTDHNFRIWFITEKDPTADQMAEAEEARKKARCPVTALSLAAFQQKLVNAASYLSARNNYPFGSVRHPDPSSPNKPVTKAEFVPIDLVDIKDRSVVSPELLANDAQTHPGISLIMGDFGAGKSMTMRHIFFDAQSRFLTNSSYKFPVFMNLRDHVGQDEPSSSLFDHGTRIGFSNPEQLVRAWRAGFVHVFLDGFDEIASSRFRSGSVGLRAVRRNAMTLVRNFVDQHPSDESNLLISGREHYFGSNDEMITSLGLPGRKFRIFTLNDFTLEQVQLYLKRLGLSVDTIPDWLPFRPLLVGYLATRGILQGDLALGSMSRADGWNYLLDQICEREGRQIQDLGGQTDQVRRYIDRLATRSRSTTSGRGPLSSADMTELFRQVFPSSPDEAAQQLLLRMAGLTGAAVDAGMVSTASDEQDSREFIDDDLVDVARAGDVCRFVDYPYDENLVQLFSDRSCATVMGELGIEVATARLFDAASGQLTTALRLAADHEAPTLAFDILRIMQALGHSAQSSDKAKPIVIKNGYVPNFELSASSDMSAVTLRECIIGTIQIDDDPTKILGPRMEECIIEEVYGISSLSEKTDHIVARSNDIGGFKGDGIANSDLRNQPIPDSVRVLVASLRKLFLQSGSARKENAFPRGLNDTEKAYVGDVLDLISSYGFATAQRNRGPILWIPNRAKRKEAISITESPTQSGNALLDDVRRL